MLQLLEWCSVGRLSIVSASDSSIVYFRSRISIIELSLPIKSITRCIFLDWEWIVVLRSVVHARKAKSWVNAELIYHVESSGYGLCRVYESILQDWGELLPNYIDKFIHILDFRIDEHECKVYEEKGSKQREQVDSELVSHRAIVPANLLSNKALASSKRIHILFVFIWSRFLHFLSWIFQNLIMFSNNLSGM